MVEPYGEVLSEAEEILKEFGFGISEDTEFGGALSDGQNSIRLFAEPYYPGLAISLVISNGKSFELGLLRDVVLNEIQEGAIDPGVFNDADPRSFFQFLNKYYKELFPPSERILAEYERQSRIRLSKFGL